MTVETKDSVDDSCYNETLDKNNAKYGTETESMTEATSFQGYYALSFIKQPNWCQFRAKKFCKF